MKFNCQTLFIFAAFLCFVFLIQGVLIAQVEETDCGSQRLKESIYENYANNYKGDIEQRKEAIRFAKEYIKRYSNCVQDEEIIKYLRSAIPQLEKGIRDEKKPDIICYYPTRPIQKLYVAFDNSYKDKEWNKLFEFGEKILKDEPEFIDVTLILASVSFNKMVKEKSDEKFVPVTITYAEKAIKFLESGKISKNFGAYDIQYKTKEYPDGKSNALGWMNYIIGYLKYHHLDQKQEAIPYFRKALEYKSEVKKFPEIQRIIDESDSDKIRESTLKNLYQNFIDNYKGICEQKKIALDAARAYLTEIKDRMWTV